MTDNDPTDRAAAVRPGEELDAAALAAYLRAALPDLAGSVSVEQFPRGFSNLTYLVRAGGREMVLRRPPHGADVRGGHDVGREFRVLSGLRPVYPKVPRPLAYCVDPAVLGAPFYLMERVPGVILRDRLPAGLELGPERMRAVCLALVDTLAELHAIDPAAAGLGGLGRPEGYAARQVEGWTGRWLRARTDEVPELEEAAAWLARSVPAGGGAALVHNDYKYDNLVLDPAEPSRVRAVLDWEMATVGDPLMDLGTTLGYWAEPGDPPELRRFGVTWLPGNLDRRGVAEAYAGRSGRDVSGILFHYVYGVFKVAVIAQQIYARFRKGHTRDPRFGGLLHVVRACGRMGAAALERERIHDLA